MKQDLQEFDLKMSARALELAAMGTGLVSPSPLVGCVIVDSSGKVVGEGTYIYDEVTHAEIIALKQAGNAAQGGTAYVSLEPHAHKGRTEACTEALVQTGIRRVVCPIEDPNPLVSGKGFRQLREAGIEVTTGILADRARELNERFILWHEKGRPFIQLKLAMSLDARISLNSSVSTAISNEVAAERVQELRHLHDAILIGGKTAISDNPLLTDRSGLPRRRKLVRIVLDNRLRIELNSELVKTAKEFPLFVITNSADHAKINLLKEAGAEVECADAHDLEKVLELIKDRNLQSVLVEGGSQVAGSFIDARLVDKATFIVAPFLVGGDEAPVAIGGKGAKSLSDVFRLTRTSVSALGCDFELTGYPTEDENG